jgi:hypothetical protein
MPLAFDLAGIGQRYCFSLLEQVDLFVDLVDHG